MSSASTENKTRFKRSILNLLSPISLPHRAVLMADSLPVSTRSDHMMQVQVYMYIHSSSQIVWHHCEPGRVHSAKYGGHPAQCADNPENTQNRSWMVVFQFESGTSLSAISFLGLRSLDAVREVARTTGWTLPIARHRLIGKYNGERVWCIYIGAAGFCAMP